MYPVYRHNILRGTLYFLVCVPLGQAEAVEGLADHTMPRASRWGVLIRRLGHIICLRFTHLLQPLWKATQCYHHIYMDKINQMLQQQKMGLVLKFMTVIISRPVLLDSDSAVKLVVVVA